jgi:hypothetical protein
MQLRRRSTDDVTQSKDTEGQAMAATVGDYLWSRLGQWGVKRVFGYPGDGIKDDPNRWRVLRNSVRQLFTH